jgi:hypothetical protein
VHAHLKLVVVHKIADTVADRGLVGPDSLGELVHTPCVLSHLLLHVLHRTPEARVNPSLNQLVTAETVPDDDPALVASAGAEGSVFFMALIFPGHVDSVAYTGREVPEHQ